MPNYTFEKHDGTTEIHEMKISELDKFLTDNPQLTQVITPTFIGDPWKQGITKPDDSFSKYILGKVKERHPNSKVERSHSIKREW